MRLHPDARAAFCRFRDTGDTAAMAQVFDLVAQQLLLVACHVAGRGQQPEDLLQETFLHAIEKADRYDASRPLEPWLLGILVNVARSDRRRRSREQQPVDSHELAAAPSDPVLENELAASVQAAIGAMPLPQREVMTWHLVHGMTSTEIAHATGRPIGTVKSWLHRGLAVVRRRMPIALTTAFAALLSGMRGTARLRDVVLRAAEAGPMAARTALGAARGTGAGINLTRMAAYAGLGTALAVPLLLWFWSPGSVTRSDGAAVHDVPATTALADDARTSERSEPSPPPPPQRTLAAEPQRTCSLTVVGKPTGETFAFSGYFLVPWVPDPHLQRVSFATDASGTYTMNGVPFGTYALVTDRGQRLTVDIDRPQQTVEVPIADGTDVTGRAIDADGRAVPGAQIWLSTKRLDDWANAAIADRDGAFVVRDVPVGWHLSATHTGHVPSALHTVAGDATQPPIELRLGGPAASITLEVVDPDGAPVANAIVQCGTGLGPTDVVNHGGTPTRLPWLCGTDERGAVVCTELPRGAAVHLLVRAPLFATVEREIAAADEPRTLRIVLPRGGTVRGRMLAANGAPVPAVVTAHTASAPAAGRLPRWCVPTCLASPDGSFCLTGITAGQTTLRAATGGTLLATTEIDVAEGSQHEWSPAIGGDAVRGIVRSSEGLALAGYRVQAETSGQRITTTTAADGTFVLNALPDGAVELRVLPPDERARFILCRSSAAQRPRADTVLTVPTARLATATLRGNLLGALRNDGDTARASLVAASGGVLDVLVAADGSFTAGPLPADTYHLVVGEHAVVLHREVTVPAFADMDLGTIHPVDPAVVTLTSGAATAASTCELRVLTDDGAAMLGYATLRGGPCEVRVPPGPCQFHLWRNGDLVAARRVELASGPLSLDLEAAVGTTVHLSAATATPSASLRVTWDIEGPGSRVRCSSVRAAALPAEAATGLRIVLPEGEYSVRARADSGETAAARMHVSPSAGPAGQQAPPLRLQ